MMKRYLDANVFLYPLLYEDDKAKACASLLKDIANKKIAAYTSVLCWDEFVYTLKVEKGREIAKQEGDKFLKFPNLVFLDARKSTLFKARQLMERYNLNPRDAIHIATAILVNIKDVISDDSDFDDINEISRIKLEDLKYSESNNK